MLGIRKMKMTDEIKAGKAEEAGKNSGVSYAEAGYTRKTSVYRQGNAAGSALLLFVMAIAMTWASIHMMYSMRNIGSMRSENSKQTLRDIEWVVGELNTHYLDYAAASGYYMYSTYPTSGKVPSKETAVYAMWNKSGSASSDSVTGTVTERMEELGITDTVPDLSNYTSTSITTVVDRRYSKFADGPIGMPELWHVNIVFKPKYPVNMGNGALREGMGKIRESNLDPRIKAVTQYSMVLTKLEKDEIAFTIYYGCGTDLALIGGLI